jgi:hypothetical protein
MWEEGGGKGKGEGGRRREGGKGIIETGSWQHLNTREEGEAKGEGGGPYHF